MLDSSSSTIIWQLTIAQNSLCLLAATDSYSRCDEGLHKDQTVSRRSRGIHVVQLTDKLSASDSRLQYKLPQHGEPDDGQSNHGHSKIA